MRRRLALLVVAALLWVGGFLWLWPEQTTPVAGRFSTETLIIDPGHGGEDGGAVSISGQVESQINLSVGLRLDALMGFFGVPALLTRDQDISIHDGDAETLREKKVSDLHNRVALIHAVGQATLISIHQNSSPSPKNRGTQVFYANGALSRPLAQLTQDTVRQALDPENTRGVQQIAPSVYLLSHVTCRAILVECGFLSNPLDDALLQRPDYQLKMAMALAAAYLQFQTTQERDSLI